MNCPAIELLTEIRDRLRDLDTLEERRRKDRERKRLVRGHEICPRTKEDEKGKEIFPPAPPIEKRAKEEENDYHDNRVRARASAGCSQPPTVAEIAAFAKEIGSDIDPAYFWRYYNSNHRRWPREWRDRLRNWAVNGIPRGRIAPEVQADGGAERSPRPTDWTLCRERCANCRGDGCACGIKLPPACEARPRPPEECPRFVQS